MVRPARSGEPQCRLAGGGEGLEGALQDALGADVDPRSGRHLAEHGQPLGLEPAELVPGGEPRHQQRVGDQHARRAGWVRKTATGLPLWTSSVSSSSSSSSVRDDGPQRLVAARGAAGAAVDDQPLAGSSATSGSRLLQSIRRAASWCQPLQRSSVPRGACTLARSPTSASTSRRDGCCGHWHTRTRRRGAGVACARAQRLALLLLVLALRRHSPRPAAAARLQRMMSAGSTSPLYVTGARRGTRCIIVLKGGDIRVERTAACSAHPSSTSSGRSRRAASRGCWRWPSTPTTDRTAASTSPTPTSPGTPGWWSTGLRRATANRANPATQARRCSRSTSPIANHNGGHLAFGPDGSCTSASATAAAAATRSNRPEHGRAAGQDPAHRRQRRPPTDPADNLADGGARDLRLRPAQPLALLVRPRHRRPLDRRRRPGPLRGDRPACRRHAGGGTNFGWSDYEGRHCYKRQPIDRRGCALPGRSSTPHGAGDCSVTGGYVYRGTAIPALQGGYVYADFCSGRVWKATGPPAKADADRRSADASSPRSARGLGGGLFVISLTGTVYRIVP